MLAGGRCGLPCDHRRESLAHLPGSAHARQASRHACRCVMPALPAGHRTPAVRGGGRHPVGHRALLQRGLVSAAVAPCQVWVAWQRAGDRLPPAPGLQCAPPGAALPATALTASGAARCCCSCAGTRTCRACPSPTTTMQRWVRVRCGAEQHGRCVRAWRLQGAPLRGRGRGSGRAPGAARLARPPRQPPCTHPGCGIAALGLHAVWPRGGLTSPGPPGWHSRGACPLHSPLSPRSAGAPWSLALT